MAAPITPKGAKSDKIWREAIQRAVRRHPDDPTPKYAQRLDALADALVASGMNGDASALREIGDRLDGKPSQQISMGQDPDLEPLKVKWEGS